MEVPPLTHEIADGQNERNAVTGAMLPFCSARAENVAPVTVFTSRKTVLLSPYSVTVFAFPLGGRVPCWTFRFERYLQEPLEACFV